MKNFYSYEEDLAVMEEVLTKEVANKAIVVFNDDVNTFEWVIMCFIQKCGHTMEQAEQCANIIHNNGQCEVKIGSYEALRPVHEALLDAGLNSKIM